MQLACERCSMDVQEGECVCVYLKEAICSPADTEPDISVSKPEGNIHQGGGDQASCR